jgi:hypothetical protein
VPPFTQTSPPATPKPALQTITSLNPLHGHVSAIHASSFFHLFLEDQQLQLGRALAGLLSPEPGSMIFGSHGALPTKGFRPLKNFSDDGSMFCHSPESWRDLWDGVIFTKGTVKVECHLKSHSRPEWMDKETVFHRMAWCVTRL